MGARKKLNGAHLTGCLAIAGLVGALAESWSVFTVCLAAFAVIDGIAGHIRLPDRHR